MLKWQQQLRRWLGETSGSSTLEYALLLGLLIGLLVLAVDLVGLSTNQTFTHVARSLENPGTANSKDGLQSAPSADKNQNQAIGSSPAKVFAGPHIALICCILTTLIIAWNALRRRCKKPDPIEILSPATAALCENLQAKFVGKRQQILRILSGNLHELTHSQVAVRHVMTDQLAMVLPQEPVQSLRERMQREQLRHLLVCRKDGTLAGVISDRDLGTRKGATAADIMTKELTGTTPDTPLSLAVTVMLKQHISCLPVLRDGKPCGVITTTDLLMALQCTMQLVQQIADQLHEPAEQQAELVG